MSTVDQGSQRITIKFGNSLEAKELSYRFHCGINGWKGIISGGWITRQTNSTVSVSPLVAEIPYQRGSYRIETLSAATVTGANSATSRLILTYNYRRQLTNYAELSFVSSGATILENQLIIGDCEFVGGALQESFDYSDRKLIEPGQTGEDDDDVANDQAAGLGGIWLRDTYNGKLYRVTCAGGSLYVTEKGAAH